MTIIEEIITDVAAILTTNVTIGVTVREDQQPIVSMTQTEVAAIIIIEKKINVQIDHQVEMI